MPVPDSRRAPGACTAADFRAAIDYSAYAARVSTAQAALPADPTFDPARPLTRDGMLAFLDREPAETTGNISAAGEARLLSRLRLLRAGVLLNLMQRDLDGRADLAEVTTGMTALAEIALTRTIAWFDATMRLEFGDPRGETGAATQSLQAVGMGKLGGGELNVSSDIDLVFVYAEEGETDGPRRIGNHEYFTRLARRVIRALDDLTSEGRVFRVDMRLRPDGESGPLACGYDMLEQYFVTQGREWERYAWIKARVVAGGSDTGLARIVQPFVFRKYLDFGAFAAMRALHAQIRAEVVRRELADNIKLGPGGIREIEFIAQVFQLIRGGREPALQLRPTLQVLDVLAARGLLPQDAARGLAAAYVFLRRLEHRLQYLDDQQTHQLPQDAVAQARVAQAMGETGYDALLAALARHRELVGRQFDAIFAGPDAEAHPLAGAWLADERMLPAALAGLGFADGEAAAARLRATRASSRYRHLSEQARTRFDRLVPRAIALAGAKPNPGATLARALDFLETICRRSAYLALLDESQDALQRVVDMLAASPWAAQYLGRNPLLLDELLDSRALYSGFDGAAFEHELRAALAAHAAPAAAAAVDTERQMDVLREMHHAQVFRLLAQDLAGRLSVERLADHLSELADRILAVTLELCWRQVGKRFGADVAETPRFAILGYGKLGGKEMGYESDLDLVFLFDDAHERAAEAYSQLGQRLVTWMTSTTPAGRLFDLDLRLRPYGDAGLLVSNLASFREYQLNHAWVWEHQALTRARLCAGDAALGRAFEETRHAILTRERALAPLAAEIAAMREKMHAAHPNRSGEFDLKHDAGGMIDIEFTVQFLVLAHARAHPELVANSGNIALLGAAAALGLIDAGLARQAQDAYREYRRRQHELRLNGAQFARVPANEIASLRAAVGELWRMVIVETAGRTGSDRRHPA